GAGRPVGPEGGAGGHVGRGDGAQRRAGAVAGRSAPVSGSRQPTKPPPVKGGSRAQLGYTSSVGKRDDHRQSVCWGGMVNESNNFVRFRSSLPFIYHCSWVVLFKAGSQRQ